MTYTAIKGNRVYTSNGVKKGIILIENTTVKDIVTDENIINTYKGEILDVGDNPVIPGLIDIHIHGAGGWTVTGGEQIDLKGLSGYLASRGVTSYQPTIGGSPL